MIVRYIDTHCHLQVMQYASDRKKIIARMRDEGIAAIVVGDDIESSKEAVVLAEKYEHLFAAVGIHPDRAKQENFDEGIFRKLTKHPKVVAVGECGLDYFRSSSDEAKNMQKELFRKHIALAIEFNKPIVIHARSGKGTNDAYQDLIALLKEAKTKSPNLRGVVHFFSGTNDEAEALFALDFSISFTAVITFARDYDVVIRSVPFANILSETDAPFVAPASRRGKRNDPLAVIDVVRQIAQLRGEDFEAVRQMLLANAECLFALRTP